MVGYPEIALEVGGEGALQTLLHGCGHAWPAPMLESLVEQRQHVVPIGEQNQPMPVTRLHCEVLEHDAAGRLPRKTASDC
jgi:hypothetical protein